MIQGINETPYNIPRDIFPMDTLMTDWYRSGLRGLRPTATLMLNTNDPNAKFFTVNEYAAHEQNVIDNWLSFEGTEYLKCLINSNQGAPGTSIFLSRYGSDYLKAANRAITAGLRGRYPATCDFVVSELRRLVAKYPQPGVKFEVCNPDVYLCDTDWMNPMAVTKEGIQNCKDLTGGLPFADPRTVMRELWAKAFPWWNLNRYRRTWIWNNCFVYFDKEQRLKQQPRNGTYDTVCECGGVQGELVTAARAAKALKPQRLYYYSWAWAGGAWLGWGNKWAELRTLSDTDPEGYANLCNRQAELRAAIAA